MAHSCFITPPQRGSNYPHYDFFHQVGFVSTSSRLYKYGGPVQRVTYAGDIFDVVVCVKDLCTFCQKWRPYTPKEMLDGMVPSPSEQRDLAEAAEESDSIDVHVSPFKGLPFVHASKDCTGDMFEPLEPDRIVQDFTVPGETKEMFVVFDDEGNRAGGVRGYRKALSCVPGCVVCRDAVSALRDD